MTEPCTIKLMRQKREENGIIGEGYADVMCSIIGNYGKWQLWISVLMGLLKLSVAWFQLGIVFLAPPQDFWCKKPAAFINYSTAQWINMSKPNSTRNHCFINDPQILLSGNYSSIDNIPSVQCTDFEYDLSTFSSTIVSEWNLVCSRQYYVEISQMTLMFGVLLGNIVFGIMADRFGRRKLLFIAVAVQTIAGFASAFSPFLAAFLVSRFLLAAASGGIAIVSFVVCMEVVGGVWRTIIPILYQVPFGVGNSIMAGFAYMLRDWRSLQIVLSLLSSAYIIIFFLLPESPRWLLATGQNEEAIAILENIAIINGRDSSTVKHTINTHYGVQNQEETEKVTLKAVLRSKNLRFKTLILSIEWFTGGLCFFAFSQHVGHVGKNIFLTVIAGGIIVIPGVLVCIPAVQKFGCKVTIVASQLLTAICFLLIVSVPLNTFPQDWPRVVFSGIGIFGLSVALPALYLYTGEIYPTVVRNAGVGCTSMFSRLGSMISPFVIILHKFSPSYPFILLSFLTFIQTIILYPLPNTKGCPLPDTIQQAEENRNIRHKSRKTAQLETLE